MIGSVRVLLVIILIGSARGAILLDWTEEDLKRLESGELVVGQELFGAEALEDQRKYQESLAPLEIPRVEEEQLPKKVPDQISADQIVAYFEKRPASFLVNPQELLVGREQADQMEFLEYHAGDSNIDLYVYIFGETQKVPLGTELDVTYQRHFSLGRPAAVVYYYLGAPERAEWRLNPKVVQGVSEEMVTRTLLKAKQEALERSDPSDQLARFTTQLSIQLHWIETSLQNQKERAANTSEDSIEKMPAVLEKAEAGQVKGRLFIAACSLLLLFGLGAFIRWAMARKKIYILPELETSSTTPLILGAPHAAGIGSVISFANTNLPASHQKKQMPDYLS